MLSLYKFVICYISNNDPYVPRQLSVDFSKKIDAKMLFVDNAGHFNTSAGFSSFETLLDNI